MIDAYSRTLPTPVNFGTLIDTGIRATANDATTISIPAPLSNEIWLLGAGVTGVSYLYLPGASEDASRAGSMLAHQIGSAEMVTLSLLYLRGTTAWPSSISLNMAPTDSEMGLAMKFRVQGAFTGIVTRQLRVNSTAATSFTMTPPANPHNRPGGIVVAAAYENSGGNGPTSCNGEGWVVEYIGLLAVGYYRLSMSGVETPPPLVITSDRSDTWTGCMAYLR